MNIEKKLSDDKLHKLKEIQLDILKQFIVICKKLKLKYYAIEGTALGTIRHGGYIPWDDDIDVCMPRPDYEIFINEGQNYLSENLFLQTNITDPEYPNNFAKIRNSSTTFIEIPMKNLNINHGIFIDIFPLDGVNKNRIRNLIYKTRIITRYYLPEIIYKISFKGNLFKILSRIITFPLSIKTVVLKREKLLKETNYLTSDLIANYCGSKNEIFPKYYFGAGVSKNFEGLEIIVPEYYDLLLKKTYGNYMQLPPEEKRISHHYCTVIDFEKSYKFYRKLIKGDDMI